MKAKLSTNMKSGRLYPGNFKKRLVAGLLVVFPIFITFFVVKFLFSLIGGILSPLVKRAFVFFGFSPSGTIDEFIVTSIAFILTFVALYFIGVIATNFFGKLILSYFEAVLHKTPIIKNIYTSSKKMIEIISLPSREAFKRVVIVEYPRVGMKAFAFVTGHIKVKDGTQLTSIFLPTTPNPTSGFLIYLSDEEIVETDLTIEEGMKLIVSGGILVPGQIEFYKEELTGETRKE